MVGDKKCVHAHWNACICVLALVFLVIRVEVDADGDGEADAHGLLAILHSQWMLNTEK